MGKNNDYTAIRVLTVMLAAVVVLTLAACPDKADNGEEVIVEKPPELVMGTAANPLIKGDVPDVSVIRVGSAYYMVSTTMYFMPVAPIMKSYDLVNWKIVSYCGDIIEDLPNFRLEESNGRLGDYGRGQWAASLNYFKNRFWVIFKNNTTNKSYRYSTANADKGPWEQVIIDRGFHDPSIFYDRDTDKTYIFHGADNITLTEMNNDLTGVKSGGIDKDIITDKEGFIGVGEGSQVYKLNGYYYVFTISWNPNRRSVHCFRSAEIEGPYMEKVVLNNAPPGGGGVAQGSIVDTPDGDWYGVFFQDRGAVGRIPFLIPMTWDGDDWPVFGANQSGFTGTIPASFEIMLAQDYETNLYYSDEFDYSSNKLHLAWQWNHNPDNDNWSLAERPGYLRLRTGRIDKTIYHARNTLTQRTREPGSTAEIALETTSMKDGDIAGLVVLQALCGFVGIEQTGAEKNIVMYTGDNDSAAYRGSNAIVEKKASVPFTGDKIYLRAVGTFSNNSSSAVFSYRTDESEPWTNIGTTVRPTFSLQHFTGVRFGLFNYATKEIGGYVDFDYYKIN
ncbi:MAG: glycoside hydrolase 43 family protein [Treponema sp.]|jgi:beta-xylosidase|nr:glycoside hydrolase 43 family protein [Treponema sp.]